MGLNGNLFYKHKSVSFETDELFPPFEGKRRNLFALAQNSTHMFEVGVNGGHSLFLALSANPKLQVTGVDICRQIEPSWGRVDIYVPAAFDWLKAAFPGRTRFITGNSLIEIPRYVENNPDQRVDLLHLDGAKDTHLREFLAIRPCLEKSGKVVLDDTHTKPVRLGMRQIIRLGMARHIGDNNIGVQMVRQHRVLEVL
ncbi:class I SAM-dependent methyltransferase [Ruegeria arenilitoris]|uniref:class I SAM-dependent methyltransferase n=1 Tax=Ruegeria arenilitoris TaxID=1173585 RepID=UPI001C2BE27A|nr:class I SAM-dependent methyltransferase [Ruegeria arenilitoris]